MIPPRDFREVGINYEEYQTVDAIMGRDRTEIGLGTFAVMCSAHCNHLDSRPLLVHI